MRTLWAHPRYCTVTITSVMELLWSVLLLVDQFDLSTQFIQPCNRSLQLRRRSDIHISSGPDHLSSTVSTAQERKHLSEKDATFYALQWERVKTERVLGGGFQSSDLLSSPLDSFLSIQLVTLPYFINRTTGPRFLTAAHSSTLPPPPALIHHWPHTVQQVHQPTRHHLYNKSETVQPYWPYT